MEKIQVSLIEDHNILRQSLIKVINSEFDLEVIGHWRNAEDALTFLETAPCDVVIMDLKLPGIDGIEATRKIKEINSKIKVIVLSAYIEDEDLYQSIQAGALGYLPKEVTIEELVKAIRSVYRGYAVLDPTITRRVLEKFNSLNKRIEKELQLSYIEKKALSLAAKGYTNKEIAKAFNLKDGAVKFHFREIFKKLQARDRAHAVAISMKQGLLE